MIPREQQLPGFSSRGEALYVPQRCCISCAEVLNPLQKDIQKLFVQSGQDIAIDRNNNERYFSLPTFTSTMEQDVTQAVYTLYNFTSDNVIEGRDRIPKVLLKKAKGIVFLTVAKAGFGFSGRYGSGVIIAKLDSGSDTGSSAGWSGPSALSLTGIGFGMQLGGEIMDLILILRSSAAVRMFMTDTQVSIGTGLSVSVGPLGRAAETNIHAGRKGATAAYSCEKPCCKYILRLMCAHLLLFLSCFVDAHCKGVFAGASLEASVMSSRDEVNRVFYGDASASPKRILSGAIPPPVAAAELYRTINEVLGVDDDATLAKKLKRQRRKEERARKLHGLQKCYGLAIPTSTEEIGGSAPNDPGGDKELSGVSVKSLRNQFRRLWTSNTFSPSAVSGTAVVHEEKVSEFPPIPVVPPVGMEVYIPAVPLDTWAVLRSRSQVAHRRRQLLDRWYRKQQNDIMRRTEEANASGTAGNISDDSSSDGYSEGSESDEDVLEGYLTPAADDSGSEAGEVESGAEVEEEGTEGANLHAARTLVGAENPLEFIDDYISQNSNSGETVPIPIVHTDPSLSPSEPVKPLRRSQSHAELVDAMSQMTMEEVELLMERRAREKAEPLGTVSMESAVIENSTTTALVLTKNVKRRRRSVISTELKPLIHLTESSHSAERDSCAGSNISAGPTTSVESDTGGQLLVDHQRLLASIFAPNLHKTQSYARWRYINQLTSSNRCMRAPSIADSDSFKNAKSVWEQLELEGYLPSELGTQLEPQAFPRTPIEDSPQSTESLLVEGAAAGTLTADLDDLGESSIEGRAPSDRTDGESRAEGSPHRRDRAKIAFKSILTTIKRAMPSSDHLRDSDSAVTGKIGTEEGVERSAMSRAINSSIFAPLSETLLSGERVADDPDADEPSGNMSSDVPVTPVHSLQVLNTRISEGSEMMEAPVQPIESVHVISDNHGCRQRRSADYDISQVVEI